MKRTNTLCALLFGLIISFNAHAGVTADGTTAYRWSGGSTFVLFTDNPADDPDSFAAPLGTAGISELSCASGKTGDAPFGLLCSGTPGDPIDNYACVENVAGPPNATNTTWCLFSENPRIGGKAWAVKYVEGVIPTNDGASIVRCEAGDRFDSKTGCRAPSQISIESGFIKLNTTDGSVPFGADCSETAHNGRMVVDDVSNVLYICTATGWRTVSTVAVP